MSETSSPRGTEPAWIRPPAGRSGERGKSRTARALGIALLGLAVMAGAVFLAGYEAKFQQVAELVAPLVFHPVTFIFLAVLGLEFIILKSGDRTRLLQVELDMIRAKRRNEVTVLRQTRDGLERVKRLCEAPQPNLEEIGKETNRLLEVIRPPEAKLLEKTEK